MGTTPDHVEVAAATSFRDRGSPQVVQLPVARIRPESGLGRKREREGHRDLQRSIGRFGVLTPITVRVSPDGSGDYLLVKGQGRTLACRLLGLETIPAIVVDANFDEADKVQQFLVENVARLKMRPVDRALLIKRARQDGEETTVIAKRFGVSPTTVRRLLAQLENASKSEVDALKNGDLSLSMHAVVARHVDSSDMSAVLQVIADSDLKPKEVETLFLALGWRQLADLGPSQQLQRLVLLAWACGVFAKTAGATMNERLRQLAFDFPSAFEAQGETFSVVAR